MPQIKIDYVVSFSSEQSEYPAINLLSKEIVNKRWVGQDKGASSNSVVLQLEKSTQISSIHIGNFHSAFIEVLVGRSEASDQKYEVLLAMSSFMSPGDSRNSINTSSVRTFTFDKLAQTIRDAKWDRIRIVCTQPYNRHVPYGLSFIHFFNSDAAKSDVAQTSKQGTVLGRFKLKNDSEDEDSGISFKPGELFARLKQKMNTSMDAQIRDASSPHNLNKNSSNLLVKSARPIAAKSTSDDVNKSDETETLSRKRDEIMYTDEDDKRNEKIDSIIERDKIDKAKNIQQNQPKLETNKSKVSKMNDLFGFGYSNKPNSTTRVSNDSTATTKTPQSNNDNASVKNTSTIRKKSPELNNDTIASTSSTASSSKVKKDDRNVLKRQSSSDDNASNKRVCVPNNDTSLQSDIIRGPGCLEGIVFVISGYVNPKRRNLRDIALSLGAKYKPDWGPTCTHLICACPNTPKHEQVRRESKFAIVVTAEWLEECGKEKACLPWKWFAIDSNQRISRPKNFTLVTNVVSTTKQHDDSVKNTDIVDVDSDEDTEDEIEKIIRIQLNKTDTLMTRKLAMSDDSDITGIEDDIVDKKKSSKVLKIDDSDDSDKTDIEENVQYKPTNSKKLQIDESDSDKTDIEENAQYKTTNSKKLLIDESDSDKTDIEEDFPVKSEKNSVNGNFIIEKSKDEYAQDTDSDSETHQNSPPPSNDSERLLDHFSGIKFYIDPSIVVQDYDVQKLKRYIVAYDGEVVNSWPDKRIDVVITTDNFVDNLQADKGKKCQFIRPEWVWKCNDEKTLYAYQDYEIRS